MCSAKSHTLHSHILQYTHCCRPKIDARLHPIDMISFHSNRFDSIRTILDLTGIILYNLFISVLSRIIIPFTLTRSAINQNDLVCDVRFVCDMRLSRNMKKKLYIYAACALYTAWAPPCLHVRLSAVSHSIPLLYLWVCHSYYHC